MRARIGWFVAGALLATAPTLAAAAVKIGTPGDDRIVGTPNADRIDGRAGDDVLLGRGGGDLLLGRRGDDLIAGGRDDDRLKGGPGSDLLRGGRGNDVIVGGKGFDEIRGGKGRDVIRARDGGRDEIDCGPGVDRAIVDWVEDGVFNCEVIVEPKPDRDERSDRGPERPRTGDGAR